jgi:hypothetical protein
MSQKNMPQRQRALILQGGAALGAYEAGVSKVLYNWITKDDPPADQHLFDIIAGTSIGAINAAIIVNHVKERLSNGMSKKQSWEGTNQILTIENEEAASLITVGFGVILIVIGLITTGIDGIWLIISAIRTERTEASSSLSETSVEMMTTMNNRRKEEEEDDWFTPKKVLAYCMIIGLISGTLSIFINSLLVLSVGAFVFASITVWYMFADKFQRWEGRRRRRTKEKYFL